jgi:hypothetical protein
MPVVTGEWTRVCGGRGSAGSRGPRPAPFGEVVVWWGDVDVGGWAMRTGAWCFRASVCFGRHHAD